MLAGTPLRSGRYVRCRSRLPVGVERLPQRRDERARFVGPAAVEQPAHERAADDHAVGDRGRLDRLLRVSRCRRRAARACR